MSGTWHEQMADAVRLRQKAINGVLRWEEKRTEAEKLIEDLSSQRQAATVLPVEPAIAPTPPVAVFNVGSSV